MANILAVQQGLIDRLRARRKEAKLSQRVLADRAQVSWGSIKRFEQTGEIALTSLLRLAVVLGYENDFNLLFARPNFQSLDEMLNAK
ncbi:MAG: helix-turn-helix domain-containing protein [Planctomycetota bacterium]|jgi:transcriptional regulator with XRE-family HTH domain|nr:helix-turn-helix domain-containing protein [Planctomycetota bacterium]